MDDDSPAQNEGNRRGAQSEKWVSPADKEFQDVYSEIESDEGKTSPEVYQREKRLEKRQGSWD